MQTKYRLNGKQINLTSEDIVIESDNFNIDSDGNITLGGSEEYPAFIVKDDNGNEVEIVPNSVYAQFDDGTWATIEKGGFGCGKDDKTNSYGVAIFADDGKDEPVIRLYDDKGNWTFLKAGGITTPSVTQTSLEKIKKNISFYSEDALETIKNAEIYSYNLKSEKDGDKKHIGFVIGDKYKTPQEVIAKSGEGIDTYAMTSILWKAVQELTKEVEKLKGGQANV